MAKLHAKKAKQHAKDRKEAESKKFIALQNFAAQWGKIVACFRKH